VDNTFLFNTLLFNTLLFNTLLFTAFSDCVFLQVPCGNQFELLGRQVYLAVSNKCPQDMAGKPRKVSSARLFTTLYYSIVLVSAEALWWRWQQCADVDHMSEVQMFRDACSHVLVVVSAVAASGSGLLYV
jgi:hypothetical protein